MVDYDSRIAALCGGSKLLVGENFQRYGLHALLVADSTGHYVEHPAMLPALDEMKNENADPIYLGRVGALRRAPNDPTGVLLATQVDDYYLSAIQRNAYLVSCAPTDGGSPPPYGCTPLPMNNLDAGADGNSWATHGLYLHIGASETKIWTLTANGRYSQSSPLTDAWRVNYFSSTDGVWSFDPNGCDGSVDTAVCHHPQRPEPSHYYGPDRRGLYAIDGFLDQLVVIVGDSLEVQVAESFPPVAASNATQLGRLILYRPSGGWSVAPPHQESQRLQPATTPALIDYVYHQVRVIDAETVLVGGYYIACYETQSGDCTKEMTSVTYGLRSFVMVFRPNAPESVAWSPMVPLDAERQLACCNHQYNSCDALPACGSQRDFWSSVPNALELYRDQQKGDIIWGLNRFVDTETEPEPHLFFFQSRLP